MTVSTRNVTGTAVLLALLPALVAGECPVHDPVPAKHLGEVPGTEGRLAVAIGGEDLAWTQDATGLDLACTAGFPEQLACEPDAPEDPVGSGQLRFDCAVTTPTSTWERFDLSLYIEDPRLLEVGTRSVSADTLLWFKRRCPGGEPFCANDSCYHSPGYVPVTLAVLEATGAPLPWPDLASPGFRRVFRVDFDFFSEGGSGYTNCSEDLSAAGSVTVTLEATPFETPVDTTCE